jgi:hypothetical protein
MARLKHMHLQHITMCQHIIILLEDHWWLRATDAQWLAYEVAEVNKARKNIGGPVGNAV